MRRGEKAGVRLDLANACLWRGEQRITLKPKDLTVLRHLAERAGQLVTKTALLEAAWPGVVVTETVLKASINRLRQALDDQARAPRFIETVHRQGYRFIAPAAASAAPVPSSEFRVSSSLPLLTPSPQPLAPFLVGRDTELAQLHHWLAKALRGERQMVFVTGEAGIGKTALIEAFLFGVRSREEFGVQNSELRTLNTELPSTPNLWLGWGQCIDHYGAGEAYMPVLEALGRLSRGPDGQTIVDCLARQAPSWLVQMPGLLSPKDLGALQRRTVGVARERMLRELAEAIDVLTAEKPLVLVLEDLQWSDVSTLDLIVALARRREPARLLVLGTYRPADVLMRGHPLPMVMQELRMHGLCRELSLSLLNESAVAAYLATRFPGTTLPAELATLVYQRTEGHPLFMVTVVEHWLAQRSLVEVEGRWEIQASLETLQTEIPTNVRQMIETQLDRLTAEEQRVVEVGSVAGVEFSAAAIAAGLQTTEATQVETVCAGLARRSLFLQSRGEQDWPDGTVAESYGFVHVLYQEVIYDQVPSAQRMDLHQRIGVREETGYGSRAGNIAARLAMHFARGRDYLRAVRYHQQAAQNAVRRSGYQEAISHANAGLALLVHLPDAPEHTAHALALHNLLGLSLSTTKGVSAAEVEQAYDRAYALTTQVTDTPEVFPILHGLWMFYLLRGALQTAHTLAERLLGLAQQAHDDDLFLEARVTLGVELLYSGEVGAARTHLEQCIALYDPRRSQAQISTYGWDFGVTLSAHAAWSLWLLGYPTQAVQASSKAVTLAQQIAHPYSLACALGFAAVLHQLRREVEATARHAQTAIILSTEQGFAHWAAMGTIVHGWAIAMQGQSEEGIAQIRQGIDAWRGNRAEVGLLYWLTLLAEVCGRIGQVEEGLRVLDEALAVGAKTGERMSEAETYRLKGTLTLQKFRVSSFEFQVEQSPRSKVQGQKKSSVVSSQLSVTDPRSLTPDPSREAEACFQKAIEIAQRQQAKSLELRATVSLARLWQQQGKKKEAHQMLSQLYGWFTEGFDTVDLQEAKALLEEL